MKNNIFLSIKFVISKINNHFNKKQCIIIFLLLIIGVLIPTLSGTNTYNFWNKLYNILLNPTYNMIFFISIGLNVIYIFFEYTKTYEIISRFHNIKCLIKNYINDIILYSSFLIFISFILAVSGSIIFSFGDFQMINHPIYDFPIYIYILFYLVRTIIISNIINITIFLMFLFIKKNFLIIIMLLNSTLFFLIPINLESINHFYNMHLLYHYYFTDTIYYSFFLEFIISLIEILLLIIIYKIIYYYATKKKRDLI